MAVVPQHNRCGSRAGRAIRTLGGVVLAGLCLAGMQAASAGRSEPIQARAPVHIIARGFEQPTGLAVHPEGDPFLTDRKTGVLYRLTPGFTAAGEPAFTSSVVFAGLDEPFGIAIDQAGHLLVAEKDKGRLVRFTPLGTVFSTPERVVDGLEDPRWLTVDG